VTGSDRFIPILHTGGSTGVNADSCDIIGRYWDWE